jgi:hypothetical protein
MSRQFELPGHQFLNGIIVILLCGCATAYKPAKSGEGYSEAQISTNEFAVGFQGNGKTDLEKATDFVLLRCAQVTLEHRFSYFAVQDSTNTSSLKTYLVRQQYYAPGSPVTSLSVLTPGSTTLSQPGYIVQYQGPKTDFRPGTVLRIKCFTAKPVKPFTYDAAALQQSLKEKYKLSYREIQSSTVAANSSR